VNNHAVLQKLERILDSIAINAPQGEDTSTAKTNATTASDGN